MFLRADLENFDVLWLEPQTILSEYIDVYHVRTEPIQQLDGTQLQVNAATEGSRGRGFISAYVPGSFKVRVPGLRRDSGFPRCNGDPVF